MSLYETKTHGRMDERKAQDSSVSDAIGIPLKRSRTMSEKSHNPLALALTLFKAFGRSEPPVHPIAETGNP